MLIMPLSLIIDDRPEVIFNVNRPAHFVVVTTTPRNSVTLFTARLQDPIAA